MQNITTCAGLKSAILLLEAKQINSKQLLKEQFRLTSERLKPINLIKNSLKDIASSPYLIENIFVTTIGLSSLYFSKKIAAGKSGNRYRKLIGSALQYGVTSVMAQHPEVIKSFGQFIIRHILSKKELNPKIGNPQ